MNWYNGFSPQQRARAGAWVRGQIDSGAVPRPARCLACGQAEGVLDYHTEDYSEPFGPHIYAYPLCYICHIMLHCRSKDERQWNDYKAKVRAGYRMPAMHARHFWKMLAAVKTGNGWKRVNAPMEVTLLDSLG